MKYLKKNHVTTAEMWENFKPNRSILLVNDRTADHKLFLKISQIDGDEYHNIDTIYVDINHSFGHK